MNETPLLPFFASVLALMYAIAVMTTDDDEDFYDDDEE